MPPTCSALRVGSKAHVNVGSLGTLGLVGQLLDLMVPARVMKPKENPDRRDAYVEYTERVDIDLITF
jgi:hypothetical protein